MASVWPTSLPQNFLTQAFQMGPVDNAIRFAPELGPPSERRRGTGQPVAISGEIGPLSPSQWTALLNFYQNTLKETDIFTWADPITNAAITCKFSGPPRITAVISGDSPRVTVTMQLLAIL